MSSQCDIHAMCDLYGELVPTHWDRVRAYVCATVSTTAFVAARSATRIARLLAIVCSGDVFFFLKNLLIVRLCECVRQ